jgi:hypothetical protein
LQKNFELKTISRSAYSEQISFWQVLIYKHLPQNFTKLIPLLYIKHHKVPSKI